MRRGLNDEFERMSSFEWHRPLNKLIWVLSCLGFGDLYDNNGSITQFQDLIITESKFTIYHCNSPVDLAVFNGELINTATEQVHIKTIRILEAWRCLCCSFVLIKKNH